MVVDYNPRVGVGIDMWRVKGLVVNTTSDPWDQGKGAYFELDRDR